MVSVIVYQCFPTRLVWHFLHVLMFRNPKKEIWGSSLFSQTIFLMQAIIQSTLWRLHLKFFSNPLKNVILILLLKFFLYPYLCPETLQSALSNELGYCHVILQLNECPTVALRHCNQHHQTNWDVIMFTCSHGMCTPPKPSSYLRFQRSICKNP